MIVDMAGVVQTFKSVAPRQVKYAVAQTLSALARDGLEALRQEMPKGSPGGAKGFDRPTPFTMRAPAMEEAQKNKLDASVFMRDSADTGQARYGYLNPGVHGTSARHQKRSEILLTRNGFLPAGYVTVPGNAMPIDPATGAMPGQYYRWIVNVLQLKVIESKGARSTYKSSAKRAQKMGVQSEVFVAQAGNRLGKGGGRLPPGVYKRLPGNRLLQMLKFVPRAAYQPRLDIAEIVTEAVKTNASKRWNAAATHAVLTAK